MVISVALGIRDLSGRDGTGQAALVALRAPGGAAGQDGAPVLLDRRDVDLVQPGLPARVYHDARELPPDRAAELVDRAERAAVAAARDALGRTAAELTEAGHPLGGVAVAIDAAGPGIPAGTPLATVLTSHSSLHVAEAALYREALTAAADELGLAVLRYQLRPLPGMLATAAGLRPDEPAERLDDWGREVGRPWRKEHREAALAAWLTLLTLDP